MQRTTYTVEQAAEYLQCHPETVRAMARSGRLRGGKIGSSWRFTEAQLLAAVEGRTTPPQEAAPVDPLAPYRPPRGTP
jgi:excisionase family DNA binding protein